ncbi:MAG TPA: glycosyltransferase [Candidatus Binatia bacterium]|jgi:glycosyltransferase involved in cell wall biosynthesis|nr:glycosyltransferase [Candidatus Binatia bacterium]
MRTVLLLAFYFPPRNHIASYRSGCFAKFLPENGWLPTVVCDDWPAGRPNYDPNFVGVIPEAVEIHRVLNPEPRGMYERFYLRKVAPYFWPYRAPILWWRQARSRILSLLQQKHFDAIWATSDPMVPLALAAEAADVGGVPWVADIRDCFNVQRLGSWYKRPLYARHERRLCARASRVVAVSEGLAQGLGRRIGKSVTVIHNGFDPTLFPETLPPRQPRFTILYAGCLVLPHRNPAPLFRAIELCLERKLIPRDQLQVCFYGSDPDLLEQAFPGATRRLPVKVLPRVPHGDILRAQMASSVLLLLSHATEKGVLTGKVFDYLAARRPILAIPDDLGEIAALLRRTGAGVALTQPEAIARQLTGWFAAWHAGEDSITSRNENEIARYSRRAQAKHLAALLDDVVAHPAAGRLP